MVPDSLRDLSMFSEIEINAVRQVQPAKEDAHDAMGPKGSRLKPANPPCVAKAQRSAAAVSTLDRAPEPKPPAGLTRREFEVLLLLAAGYSNAAIAERLVVSNGTVRQHLVSIYRKLDIFSRTEAMRYVIDHHLA